MLDGLVNRHPVPIAVIERDNDLASLRSLPGYAALKRKLTDTSDDDIDE
jgi:hypothetical protein